MSMKYKYLITAIVTFSLFQLWHRSQNTNTSFDIGEIVTEMNQACPKSSGKGFEMLRVELRENRYVTFVFKFRDLQETEIDLKYLKEEEEAKLAKRLQLHSKSYALILNNGYSIARAILDKNNKEVCYIKHN